jgi:hypothetical protein
VYVQFSDTILGITFNDLFSLPTQTKILRMTHEPDGAIRALQDFLSPERPQSFIQADTLVRLPVAR